MSSIPAPVQGSLYMVHWCKNEPEFLLSEPFGLPRQKILCTIPSNSIVMFLNETTTSWTISDKDCFYKISYRQYVGWVHFFFEADRLEQVVNLEP